MDRNSLGLLFNQWVVKFRLNTSFFSLISEILPGNLAR